MTIFQLLMLGASAFFAFKIYEHIQTLQDTEDVSAEVENIQEKSAVAFSPFSPEVLVQKADEAYENDDKLKALAFLNEANAKEPNNPDILYKIAYILEKQNDNQEALEYYKAALELDKNDALIHNAIASLYRKNGEFISAKIHLYASIEIDKRNPITYYNYGNLLVDMTRYEEAISMYEKAIQLNPEFTEAKEELSKLKGK